MGRARYWTSVHPVVTRELVRWRRHALSIPDPVLRQHALDKLHDAGEHAQVAAILATLAPRHAREAVVTAMVALEVAYDYLDALTEQPGADTVANGLALHAALGDSVGASSSGRYYRLHPQHDDGGYLHTLVTTCRDRFEQLPSSAHVAPTIQRTAAACGEAQTRAHAVPRAGFDQLANWAIQTVDTGDLFWWETAAGLAASIISVHAQIAAAATSVGTSDVEALAAGYLPVCALITMLDSIIDLPRDIADGSHNFASYYPDTAIAAARIVALAGIAATASTAIHGDSRHHHLLLIAGAIGFYLSSPMIDPRLRRLILAELPGSIRPLAWVITLVFRVWQR